MKSSQPGKRTSKNKSSDVEVVSVSPQGICLHVLGDEYLLRYDDHPWFRDVPVSKIFNVQLLHGQHLIWPDCEIDLHVDSLRTPERYPLISKRNR